MIFGDTRGLENYIGSVGGILSALANPAVQERFTASVTSRLQKRFMHDSIAANRAGSENIRHMFEQPEQGPDGVANDVTSDIPLFRLKSYGSGSDRIIGFDFLPSHRLVPLPDPARYGFNPEKLQYLSRHKFKMKALVMETMSSVTINPTKSHGRLFIPSASAERGYFMHAGSTTINPGGYGATGGFSQWWFAWFAGPAQLIVESESLAAEEIIAATGQKVTRYAAGTVIDGQKVGGQFMRPAPVVIGYINAAKRAAEAQMTAAMFTRYGEGGDDE